MAMVRRRWVAWCCLAIGAAQGQTTPASARYDGPAELPRISVDVSLPRQTGSILTVRKGEDLQHALDGAHCGDTIRLQSGATFRGAFVLPAKPCDDAHWIVIRTSAPDSELPPPGKRLTPCFAGVASIPGRPDLHCVSIKAVTARLEGTTSDGPIQFAPGANHYRLLGLEITRAPASPKLPIVYAIASASPEAAADHIIFDRIWGHGTPQDETAHGIRLNGITYAAIVDSTLTDFHCIARSGSCTDSQAISGGNGSLPAGPFLIEGDFLEAAGENIMFGGGNGTVTPTDITIRRNHLFRPLSWQRGQPGFVGGPDGNAFIVKNNFELKVGVRVLFEGNVLENSWGGFSQDGFAILLTPRNGAPAPRTEVADVTIRDCMVRHTGSGMQIANPAGEPVPSVAGERYSIHDIVFDDLDHVRFEGHGNLAQISMSPKPGTPVLRRVSIRHVTAFPKRVLFSIGGPLPAQMSDFVFIDNLVGAGEFAMSSTGAPCSDISGQRDPFSIVSHCFRTVEFRNNVIVDSPTGSWPKGNLLVKNPATAGVTNFNSGHGGDYRLSPDSKFKGKGTDGRDIGADISAVQAATAGVE